ncbi:MAG: S8 family serine peptidase [Deltaproteobacteria bacterium]|nr:S8 family serine peptidase [Deltaproteobacteria bacterium]
MGALLLVAAASQAAPPPLSHPSGTLARKLRGSLPVVFAPRPAVDGSGGVLAAAQEAPVVIRLRQAPEARLLAALRERGAAVALRRDGRPRGLGRNITALASAQSLPALAALPEVEAIALDGAPFGFPRPLDYTAAEIQAVDAWRTALGDGTPLAGQGVTVCDVDSGIDVFHPLFFRADGGYFRWLDRNADGVFNPGVDAVDADGDGNAEPLRVLNSVITAYRPSEPWFNSDDPTLQVGLDWLYADENDNGQRDFGPAAGFDDASPGFGELLFAVDDVDRDGRLDPEEKLVLLGSSKLKLVRRGKDEFRRGEDLTSAPLEQSIDHGTGAASVIAGGNRGLGRLVGIAPDAELVAASDTEGGQLELMSDFCVDEGARVVLHEYAPWYGEFLDGSSPLEQLIDETSMQGVAHVNPAGNLSGSQKLYQRQQPAGAQTVIAIEAPAYYPRGLFHFIGITLLWRQPERQLEVVLEDPERRAKTMPLGPQYLYEGWGDDLYIYAQRGTSERGTTKLDIWIYGPDKEPPPIPLGTWKLRVTDPAPPEAPALELIAYVVDDLSSWGKGIYFPDDWSEEHLIGWPGTADHAVAVAAYTGHGFLWGTPGERAPYSGRGHRIDGAAILSISAPDDPIVAGYTEGKQAKYMLYGGTSGASPHVAGVAALLLQLRPEWTGIRVREAIREGALADAAVGEAPNDDYGYGKLRAYRAMYGVDPPGGEPPRIDVAVPLLYAGASGTVSVVVHDPDEGASRVRVELDRDYDGVYDEPVEGGSFAVRYDEPGVYVSKLRATDSTGRQGTVLARLEVLAPPGRPRRGPALLDAGGGCSFPAGRGQGGAALALVLAVGLALARRSGRQETTEPLGVCRRKN